MNQSGYNIPDNTADGYYKDNTHFTDITKDQAKPGDLVFFNNTANPNGRATHVGFVTEDGFIGSQSSTGPASVDLNKSKYWNSRIIGYKRVN